VWPLVAPGFGRLAPMSFPKTTTALGLLLLAALGCGAPEGGRAGAEDPLPPAVDAAAGGGATQEGGLEGDHAGAAAMDRTRAQFEAARHGAAAHAARGCPLCADPMAGSVPAEALLNGPAEVWN
jgi:hypothetical protein